MARHDHDGYDDDHRVRALRKHDIGTVDEDRMVLVFEHDDGEGEAVELELPVRWGVCPTCRGKGTHVNPSIDAHGITSEEFDDDPDFRDSYFAGDYDVPCYGCGGRRVTPEIDQKRADPETLRIYDDRQEDAADYEQLCAAERRMGA